MQRQPLDQSRFGAENRSLRWITAVVAWRNHRQWQGTYSLAVPYEMFELISKMGDNTGVFVASAASDVDNRRLNRSRRSKREPLPLHPKFEQAANRGPACGSAHQAVIFWRGRAARVRSSRAIHHGSSHWRIRCPARAGANNEFGPALRGPCARARLSAGKNTIGDVCEQII
jgi:hypothetical protein